MYTYVYIFWYAETIKTLHLTRKKKKKKKKKKTLTGILNSLVSWSWKIDYRDQTIMIVQLAGLR